MPQFVAVIKMIAPRIIEIDGAFYETKTEKSHIEIQISLRIAGDRSNVMKTMNFAFHKATMSIVSFSW